jgi:ABC-type nitrate/sulfonate/bicarbonate transport system ATPase subunit
VFTAIDNISLDIAPGSFFVIVGPSGCGKTTLLRILAEPLVCYADSGGNRWHPSSPKMPLSTGANAR